MTLQVGCKLSLVFFQYCTMANFYWLLVEGLYLHTLLVAMLSPGRRFLAYLLIGWGKDAPPWPCAPSTTPGALRCPDASPCRGPFRPIRVFLGRRGSHAQTPPAGAGRAPSLRSWPHATEPGLGRG